MLQHMQLIIDQCAVKPPGQMVSPLFFLGCPPHVIGSKVFPPPLSGTLPSYKYTLPGAQDAKDDFPFEKLVSQFHKKTSLGCSIAFL